MIVDTSVLVRILLQEPGWEMLSALLEDAAAPKMAAPTLLELRTVIAGRKNAVLAAELETLLGHYRVRIVPFTEEHGAIAFEAYRQYGKGFHPRARLNLGDCFSYALAKATGEPLLFVGDDFTHTDLIPALTR